MSKITVAAVFVATVALGACAKHHTPEPAPEPMPEPIFVEPTGGKHR